MSAFRNVCAPMSGRAPAIDLLGDPTPYPERSAARTEAKRLESCARILVVDDNTISQCLVRCMLGNMGIRTEAAKNGHAAVDLVSRRRYDLILMDCQMPSMDGYEAARVIRRQEETGRRPRVPIVAMTANAIRGAWERCLEAGMDDYMSKPFGQGQLRGFLDRWLPAGTRPWPRDATVI